jgi:hypothetical protein
VEGQNGHTPAGTHAGGQGTQESIQGAELFVYGDSHGLKNTPDRFLHEFGRPVRQSALDGVGQVCRGLEAFPCKARYERGGIRFIGLFNQSLLERDWCEKKS